DLRQCLLTGASGMPCLPKSGSAVLIELSATPNGSRLRPVARATAVSPLFPPLAPIIQANSQVGTRVPQCFRYERYKYQNEPADSDQAEQGSMQYAGACWRPNEK